MYKYIFAMDPSGSFNEGNGTTGWVLMDYKERLLERGYIPASDYDCPEAYWNEHAKLIKKYNKLCKNDLVVVVEDYVLYRDRSANQTNSQMETCRLLGVIQHTCWELHQPYTLQLAATVKHRWSDELLFREGIIYREKKNIKHRQSGLSLGLVHTRDAFRHAQHYAVCRNKDKPKKREPKAYGPKYYKDFRQSNY